MKRLFLAVDFSPEVVAEIHRFSIELKSALEPRVRRMSWVRPENLHMTLKFLGNTEELAMKSLIECVSHVAAGFSEMTLQAKGVGAFPNPQRPRVLWVGVQENEPVLQSLATELEKALVNAGFPKSDHAFSPHLTIARIKESKNLRTTLDPFREKEFGVSTVREVVLYESFLSSEGSRYVPLNRFYLKRPLL